jgi:adenylate cyclase
MGPQPLKNIAEPMQAWRVRLSGQSVAKTQPGLPAGQASLPELSDNPPSQFFRFRT